MPRLWPWLFCAFLFSWAASAAAQERLRVVVLAPAAATPLERELLTRLRGELSAAGFEVLGVPLTRDGDPEQAVVTAGVELEPVAAFATGRSATAGLPPGAASTLRVWLSDRVAGLLLDAGQALEGSPDASRLAVQAVELLQARVADWQWRPPPPPLAPKAAPVVSVEQARVELMAALDVGLLWDGATGGVALTPLIRLSYATQVTRWGGWSVDLGARLSAAGLGAPTVLQAPARQVDVVQSFALLEGVIALDPGGWLRLFGTLGAGAYQVNVEGIGQGEVVGRSEDTLSPTLGAGIGVALHPFRFLMGKLEAQGLFAISPTDVEIDNRSVATFGRPLYVLSIGAGLVL